MASSRLSVPQMDVIDVARYFGALMLVLALVGIAALAARRYGLAGIVKGSASRRLAIVETLMIDPKHKFVLLRRDDREHLVMIGPGGGSIVETGLSAAQSSAPGGHIS